MVDDQSIKVLISQEDLHERIKEMGAQLTEDYRDGNLFVVGILKGAFVFMADLIRSIDLPLEVDFVAISSYGSGTKQTGVVRILKDLDSTIEGKDVLIVEDIIDSGLTLKYLVENLSSRKPRSLRICTLLDKPERREVDISTDYTGFVIPNLFVVGYGLDHDQIYRNLPYVGIV
ncbi:MAG: hypoxanthine phosphoribosyltransferase [Limnochordia bacterium]|nr:hypoxanthine phosphoribosyltransferase [Limnochordia bacterium]MDD2628989.1 hypoxanthine phosphoribosyltransferase [Limnochordia bacterium]MDD4518626.1 hypoxanthine phosphoribosyltransferase [Limnochordia bacterium]